MIVFHDSRDWGRDIQLSIDLLRAKNGVFDTVKDVSDPKEWTPEKQLPIFFSADVSFAFAFCLWD